MGKPYPSVLMRPHCSHKWVNWEKILLNGPILGHDDLMHKRIKTCAFTFLFALAFMGLNVMFTQDIQAQDTAPNTPPTENLGLASSERAYSEAEIRILQELEVRRVELERRSQALELREQLVDLMEAQMTDKINQLTALRNDLRVLIGNISGKEDSELEQLAKVYEAMKPPAAATVLDRLDNLIVYDLFRKMNPKKTAKIMEALDPAKARFISELLAERIDLPAAPK